jgi:hypothetical protein
MQGNITQGNVMHSAMQPFLRFGQAHMDLLTKFSTSLDMTPGAASDAPNSLYPGLALAGNLVRSNGFVELMQGMLGNYIEFMVESAKSGMAVMVESRTALMRQAQEDVQNVIDAAEARDTAQARGRRAHQGRLDEAGRPA